MIRIKLKKRSKFRSAIKDGVLYLEIPIAFDTVRVTALDVGKVINVCIPYHLEYVENELLCRVEEFYIKNNKQYIIARVLSVGGDATV